MRNYRLLFFVLTLALLLCTLAGAHGVLTPKEELTFNGKTLSSYASVQEVPEIEGYSAYAINLNTGTVMYEKNSRDIVYPASTVKLMTAIVAFENIPNLDVEITHEKTYSAKELLNALLIGGDNDAAEALAIHVAGNVKDFCALMNEKAKEIGAEDTHFDNVTGFHADTQVTTARDTAIIGQYFYYIPELFEMCNTTRFQTDRMVVTNRNFLLQKVTTDAYFYSKAEGMNVGSTPEGGNCIVSTVTGNDGLVYLCVVMNSRKIDDVNHAYVDIRKIFDFCTDNFSYHTVASTSTIMSELDVRNAVDVDSFALFPSEDVKVLLPNDLDYANDITFEKRVFAEKAEAPVNKGAEFGEIVVKYKGDVIIGRAKLVSDVSLDKSNVLYFFSRVESIVKGTWFTVFVVTASVLFAVYFGLSIYYRYFRKSKYTGTRLRK